MGRSALGRRAQGTRRSASADARKVRRPLARMAPPASVGTEARFWGRSYRVFDGQHPSRGADGSLPLVVLTGSSPRDPREMADLLEAGAVIVMASHSGAIRAWLPGALLGADRLTLPHIVVRVSHLEVDLTEQKARWLDKALEVSPHELRLLAALGEESGRVWTFEQLSMRVWGTSFFGGREPIHSAVKRLRGKLARVGAAVSVESVRGVGFRLDVQTPRSGTLSGGGRLSALRANARARARGHSRPVGGS